MSCVSFKQVYTGEKNSLQIWHNYGIGMYRSFKQKDSTQLQLYSIMQTL